MRLNGFRTGLVFGVVAALAASSPSAFAADSEWTAAQLTQVATASQQRLGEEALFVRCFTHLTRRQPARNHPLRAQVRKGTSTAVAACMSLLGKAGFVTSGDRKGRIGDESDDTRAILETFNTFHQSWFPATSFTNNVAFGECFDDDAARIFDFGEPALYPTRALFNATVPYKEIVTAPTSLSAVRSANASAPRTGMIYQYNDVEKAPSLPIILPQLGKLIGVVPLADSDRSVPVIMGDTREYVWASETFNARTHHGGGLLGSQPYLLLNSGRGINEHMDGGVLQHRRWSSAIYRDLLCRDLPVIRPQDAKLYVQPAAPGRPSFRQGQSCMQCHASIDPMAGTIAHLAIGTWGRGGGACENAYFAARPAGTGSLPRAPGMVDSDPDFYKRPTYGKLYFRSYDGTLVSKEVKDLASLGAALADTNDLYVCAASRYFQYFTGIAVNLQDSGDPSLPVLNASEMKYRAEVVNLGLHLKQHQRLDKLIDEILRSPLYQKASMRQLAGE